MSIIHKIIKSRVSLLNKLKCDHPTFAQGENILVLTELTIATLFAQVLMVSHLMPTRVSLPTQQAEQFIEALHITQMAYF
jgi:hypothetical protein